VQQDRRRQDEGVLIGGNAAAIRRRHVYVSSGNHGWSACDYLAALPAKAIGEIHLPMNSASPSLLEVQRALLASLADGRHEAAASFVLADGLEAAARLSIYRNTATSTLTGTLRLTFPAVLKLVGEEFFEGAARAFVDRAPALGAWLDEYGAGFVSFIAQFPPASSLPYLPDVAALEWAVSRALHAPDVAAIDPARLAALSAAQSEQLRLVPHPALSLVRADSPADAIWHAVLDDDDAALASIDPTDAPAHLLIERRVQASGEQPLTTVQVQRLSEPAWRLTAALCAGRALGPALQENAEADAEHLLAEHLAAGRFVDFTLCASAVD
jgi:hypothetical protein